MDTQRAEALALEAFTWIADEEDRLARFLSLTGTDAASLRRGLRDPAFLAGILDYLLNHEAMLLGFCAVAETAPRSVEAARRALPGPEVDL